MFSSQLLKIIFIIAVTNWDLKNLSERKNINYFLPAMKIIKVSLGFIFALEATFGFLI